MGQRITVEARTMGTIAVFTGDRSLTGQDGEAYDAASVASADGGFGATLARRLFELDDTVDHVFVHSNNVVVRRTTPWDEANLRFANDTIESLFIHYGADRGPDEAPVGGEGRGLTVADHDGEAGDIVDPATASGLRATHYNATITGITRTHETLWIMQVTPDEDLGPYAAGQYTTLGLGYWEPRIDGRREDLPEGQLKKLARRSYSISSSILDDSGRLIDLAAHPSLEFYVVLVEKDWQETPAILTPRLFLKDVGDRLFLGRKVAGRYRLDKVGDPESDVVMLATGTGEAPHNAMTVELLRNGHRGRIVSVCTVRYRRDLAYLDIHRRVEERWDNYRYIPMTTREPENEGAKVYIQDMVTSGMLEEVVGREISPEHTHFFLCGNPAMIGLPEWEGDEPTFPETAGVAEILVERGFTIDRRGVAGNVHYEEYW